MADQIAINVRVIDSEVGPRLRQVRDQIKGAFADAERSAKGFGAANAGALKSLNELKAGALGAFAGRARLAGEFEEGSEGAHKLVESLHGLSPVLESLGLGLSNMRGFAAAARFGLAGFAAVAAGAVAVGLEKASDHAEEARKKIKDLGGTDKEFEGLQASTRKTGSDIDNLTKATELYKTARGNAGLRFGGAPPIDVLSKLFTTGAGTVAGGDKDLINFLSAVAKSPSGRITGEAAKALESQGVAARLLDLFNLPNNQVTPKLSLEKGLGATGRSLPDLETHLRFRQESIDRDFANRPVGLDDAVSRLLNSGRSRVEGVRVLAPFLNNLADKANQSAEDQDRRQLQFGPDLPRRDTTGGFRRLIQPEPQSFNDRAGQMFDTSRLQSNLDAAASAAANFAATLNSQDSTLYRLSSGGQRQSSVQ